MEDLLTGDIRPVRRAPPPPSSRKNVPQPRNNDLLVIQTEDPFEQLSTRKSNNPPQQKAAKNGLPRSVTLPIPNGTQKKKAPPPRPPPPKASSAQLTAEKPHPIFHRLHKFSVRKKPHHQQEQNGVSNRSGSVMSGMFGRSRGPPPSRPKASPAHGSVSAPSTPVTEASLIDLTSPPGSPTTRSGSDGLSVNSFGSECSSGNQSSGFDDSFDPFGSVDPFRSISDYVPTKTAGVSSFFVGSAAEYPSQSTTAATASDNDTDPFEMLARRTQKNMAQTQNVALPTMQTQNLASSIIVPHPSAQPVGQPLSNKTEQKGSFRPTIIRPKAPVTSSHVESAGGSSMSKVNQYSDLGNIDWSAGSKASTGWDTGTTNIIDQTIPEEPPPLPPRPESEEDEHDRPYGVAEFEFESSQQGDLQFKPNDVIQLLYRVNEDWMFGRCGLNEGIFPQSFVKIMVPLAGEEASSFSSTASTPTNLAGSRSSTSPVPSLSSSLPNYTTVTALYSFQAEAPEDLSLCEGNKIAVLGRLSEEWLYGECDGKCGQFPANFVDKIPPNLPQM